MKIEIIGSGKNKWLNPLLDAFDVISIAIKNEFEYKELLRILERDTTILWASGDLPTKLDMRLKYDMFLRIGKNMKLSYSSYPMDDSKKIYRAEDIIELYK